MDLPTKWVLPLSFGEENWVFRQKSLTGWSTSPVTMKHCTCIEKKVEWLFLGYKSDNETTPCLQHMWIANTCKTFTLKLNLNVCFEKLFYFASSKSMRSDKWIKGFYTFVLASFNKTAIFTPRSGCEVICERSGERVSRMSRWVKLSSTASASHCALLQLHCNRWKQTNYFSTFQNVFPSQF